MGLDRTSNPQLRSYDAVAEGLAQMLGPDCEVVLHDLSQMPHSIVAIENGHVTGRRPGDAPTDQMLRSLRNSDDTPDVRLYVTSNDGKVLKSLAVTLRDDEGRPIGVLGVNLDVSDIVHAQRTLAAFATVAGPGSGDAPVTKELFDGDIRDVLAGMIAATLTDMRKTPATMTRDEKMEVVARLEERGAFLVKRSAEQVAEALDLSRFTVFSYLKDILAANLARPACPAAPTQGDAAADLGKTADAGAPAGGPNRPDTAQRSR